MGHMSIVVSGRYLYRRVDAMGWTHSEVVDKGEDWIAEPVLWTRSWIHIGILTAIKHAVNVSIDAKVFGDQVRLNPQAHVFSGTTRCRPQSSLISPKGSWCRICASVSWQMSS